MHASIVLVQTNFVCLKICVFKLKELVLRTVFSITTNSLIATVPFIRSRVYLKTSYLCIPST